MLDEEGLPYLPEGIDQLYALDPAELRTVLILHDVEGFKHTEIAERLGVTEGTSKSQLWSARRRLRCMLEPDRNEMGDVR